MKWLSKFTNKENEDLLKAKHKIFIIFLVLVVFTINTSFISGFFFGLFLLSLSFKLNSKWTTFLGVFFLVMIPFLLVFGFAKQAEDLAIVVYYLFLLSIFIELKNYFFGQDRKIKLSDYVYLEKTSIGNNIKLLQYSSSGFSYSNTWKKIYNFFASKIDVISRIRFSKIGIWRFTVVLISLILPIIIFQFKGLPYFRDLKSFPFINNISFQLLDINSIESLIFNKLVGVGISPNLLVESFFIIWFFLGVFLTFVFLLKIKLIFSRKSNKLSDKIFQEVSILLISLVYVYNPFIFERFLMGQYFVLRGHFLFIPILYYLIKFLQLFWNPHPISGKISEDSIQFKKNVSSRILSLFEGKQESFEYFDRLSKLGILFILISLTSTHHTVFLYYLIVTSLLFFTVSRLIHIRKYVIEPKLIIRSFIILLIVLLPSFLILLNRYSGTSQYQYYSQNLIGKKSPDIKQDIIRSFSLRTKDDEHLLINGLLGSASWDSKSFVETYKIQDKLGILAYFSPYYNYTIGLLFIFLFSFILLCLFYQSDKHFKPILYPFLVLIPISLILVFGYSNGLKFINQIFFNLPGSYVFRESGKFYSLFLSLFALLFVVYSNYLKKTIYNITIGTFLAYLISSIILFIPLTDSIQYLDTVNNRQYREIIEFTQNKCVDGKNVLYLPFESYINTSFSEIYVAYPFSEALDCKVLKPSKATLTNFNKKNDLVLVDEELDHQIDKIVNDFINSDGRETSFISLKAQLKSLDVSLLIVDEEKNPKLALFNDNLETRIAPEIKIDQVYIYTFDWVK
jgi:hypothetical protein